MCELFPEEAKARLFGRRCSSCVCVLPALHLIVVISVAAAAAVNAKIFGGPLGVFTVWENCWAITSHHYLLSHLVLSIHHRSDTPFLSNRHCPSVSAFCTTTSTTAASVPCVNVWTFFRTTEVTSVVVVLSLPPPLCCWQSLGAASYFQKSLT